MRKFNKTIPFIPYFETSRYRVNAMIELAEIRSSDLVADLGSGDGRISIAAAQAGAQVTGFELDDRLFTLSESEIAQQNLQDKITILKQDFWETNFATFTVIMIYPMPDIMERLETKLLSELKPGSRVLTNYYQFPNWKYEKTKDKVYLYHVAFKQTS